MSSDILYKYVDLEAGINKILIDKTIKFTNPIEFNDPFDCDEDLIHLNITERFLCEFISRKQPNKNREERRKLQKEISNHKKRFEAIFNVMLKKQKEKFRVSCFSKTEREILMWSHYADKHGGMCIGFEKSGFERNPDFAPAEVRYLNEFKPYEYDMDNMEAFKGWLTTKSERWFYEKEVRLINNQRKDIISFDKKHVKEVIFGIKVCESEIIKVIKNLIKEGYNHTEFYKMEKEKNYFRLNKNKINSYA